MTKHITVTLTEAQEAHLLAAAARGDQSVEAVVAELIQRQMDHDAWFIGEVQKGIDAANRGELVSHEQVVANGRKLRAELRAARPKT
jgi:predicted transcriptional regulator